jgi:ParB/RepB/Spo0J family partition protein
MKTQKLIAVKLADVTPSLTNPRKTITAGPDWPEFVNSIRTHGVKQPPLVRPFPASRKDKNPALWEIVAGERRFTAAKEVKLESLNVLVEELTDAEAVEIQQIENLQRADLSPLEEAQGYADWRDSLLKAGTVKTVEEAVAHIAAKIDRKRTAVFGKLALLKTAPVVQEALKAGKLDQSKAGLIAQIPDVKAQQEVLKMAITPERGSEDVPSYRELKAVIQSNYRINLKQSPFKTDAVFVSVKLDGKPAPTCLACPYRTGNMPEAEGDANICTNPECFRAKCAATASNQHPAIAGIWDQKTYENKRYSNDYVTEDTTCYEAPGYKKWGEILGKQAPAAIYAMVGDRYGRSETMELKRIWKKADVLKLAKEKGLIKPAPKHKPSEAELKEKKRREEEQAKRDAAEAALHAKVSEISGVHAGNLLKNSPATFWRKLALTLLVGKADGQGFDERIFKGRNLPFSDDDTANEKTLTNYINTTPTDNLPGFVVSMLLGEMDTFSYRDEVSNLEEAVNLWAPQTAGKFATDKPAAKKPAPAKPAPATAKRMVKTIKKLAKTAKKGK